MNVKTALKRGAATRLKPALIKTIHVGKNRLGLDDDTYRDLLESAIGLRSTTAATVAQLELVLDRMRKLGFEPVNKAGKPYGAKPRQALGKVALTGKIEALLSEAGRHWNYAHGCASKMFGKERLEFCDEDQLWRIVAALEKDKARRIKREKIDHPAD